MNETDICKKNSPFFHASINYVKDIFIHSINTIQKLYDGGATSVNLTLPKYKQASVHARRLEREKAKKGKKSKNSKKGSGTIFYNFVIIKKQC